MKSDAHQRIISNLIVYSLFWFIFFLIISLADARVNLSRSQEFDDPSTSFQIPVGSTAKKSKSDC